MTFDEFLNKAASESVNGGSGEWQERRCVCGKRAEYKVSLGEYLCGDCWSAEYGPVED